MKLNLILCGVAVAAGTLIPASIGIEIARVLVPAIALLATGIFPSMTLVVNAMKAEERTPKLIEDLYSHLRQILRVLATTFTLAALSIAVLATISAGGGPRGFLLTAPVWVQKAALITACVFIALLISRVIALGRVFFAILDVNRKQALITARSKNRKNWDGTISKMVVDLPDDYGAVMGPLREIH